MKWIIIPIACTTVCLSFDYTHQFSPSDDSTLSSVDAEASMLSVGTAPNLQSCEDIVEPVLDQYCIFNPTVIHLVEFKGSGTYGNVWKVLYWNYLDSNNETPYNHQLSFDVNFADAPNGLLYCLVISTSFEKNLWLFCLFYFS